MTLSGPDELRSLRAVAHLPAPVAQLVAEPVRLDEVAIAARRVAPLRQRDDLVGSLFVRLEQPLQPGDAEHLAQVRVAAAGRQAVRLADPLVQRGERARGVE